MSLFSALVVFMGFSVVIWAIKDPLILFVLAMVASFVALNVTAIFDSTSVFTATQLYFMQLFWATICAIGIYRSVLNAKKITSKE